MKRIKNILIALFFILSAGQLWAQENVSALPYKSAASFEGDTVRYLEYNYRMRAEQYAGKTVGEILKELEYPALYIVQHRSFGGKVLSLDMSVQQVGEEPSPLKDYYICVAFENPPTFDEYKEISKFSSENRNPVFSQKLYDFIKDMKVSGVGFNPYMSKDPATLKRMREIREENDRKGRESAKIWEKLVREKEAREEAEQLMRNQEN